MPRSHYRGLSISMTTANENSLFFAPWGITNTLSKASRLGNTLLYKDAAGLAALIYRLKAAGTYSVGALFPIRDGNVSGSRLR